MICLNNVLVAEISQDGQQEPPIPVVCHTTSIVTFSSQICYGFKGHLAIFIYNQLNIKETKCAIKFYNSDKFTTKISNLKVPEAYTKIRLIKGIGNIPTQRTKFLPLLNKRVEEAQSK